MKAKNPIYLFGLGLFVLLAQHLTGQTTVTIDITEDAMVSSYSSYVDRNFGTYIYDRAARWTAGSWYTQRTLIRPDLSSVPSDALILSAKLYLYSADDGSQWNKHWPYQYTNMSPLYRITEDWDESTVTWNNQPQYEGTVWTYVPHTTDPWADHVIDITQLAQNWHDGTYENYGMLMRLYYENNGYTQMTFASSDNPNATKHPKLEVTYVRTKNIQIGSSNLVSSGQSDGTIITPFGTGSENGANQYLVTRQELNDAGFQSGDIYSISFKVSEFGGMNLDWMNVYIGQTGSGDLSSGYIGAPSGDGQFEGLSHVYSGSYNIVEGWNTISFSSPFNWDGASNIVVQLCIDNETFYHNSTVYYINTDFISTIGDSQDDGLGLCDFMGFDTQQEYARPIMRFGIAGNFVDYTPYTPPSGYTINRASDKNYVHKIIPLTEKTKAQIPALDSDTRDPKDFNEQISYFDGLGRPVQNIDVAASPLGNDAIKVFEYDEYGRENYQYPPFTTEGLAPSHAGYRDGAIARQEGFYMAKHPSEAGLNGEYAKAETIFEGSPLNRVLEQGAPGEDWQVDKSSGASTGLGHTVKYGYAINTSGEARIWKWDASNGFYSNSAYSAGELYVTVAYDENYQPGDGDLHTTREYKDKNGKVILKRAYVEDGSGGTDVLNTYYVYNGFGLLAGVIPPLAYANKATDGGTELIPTDVEDNLCYSYTYDERKRMVEKKLPGAGAVYLVYDNRDRLILSQDGDMRARNLWKNIKYDVLDRPVFEAVIGSDVAHTRNEVAQDVADNSSPVFYTSQWPYNPSYWYDIYEGCYPDFDYTSFWNGMHPTSINYYDNYDILNKVTGFGYSAPDKVALGLEDVVFDGFTANEEAGSVNTTGLMTAHNVYSEDLGKFFMSVYYYDSKGRAVQVVSENHLGGIDRTSTKYSFTGQVLAIVTEHDKGDGTGTVTGERFVYDHSGRLVEHYHQIDGEEEILLAANRYNELGEPVEKFYHGQPVGGGIQATQKVDYKYNIRGWLTDINDLSDLGTDLYAMQLMYQKEGGGIGNISANCPGYEKQFNGNISAIGVATAYTSGEGYCFKYDGLGRLSGATGISDMGASWSPSGGHNTSYAYDLNGNILSLSREAQDGTPLDNLAYSYKNNNKSNQLLSVTDNADKALGFKDGAALSEEYGYDANGNLLFDGNKGISDITYSIISSRNLPIRITRNGKKSKFSYTEDGTKLSHFDAQNSKTTDYIGNFVYENGSLAYILTSEGRIVAHNGEYEYEYFLKDHLGNTRVVMGHDGTVSQVAGYYPFGMRQEPMAVEDAGQKYLYNGKELQEDVDWYDYGARMYDASLGRWHTTDPKSEKYCLVSPYNYAINNPIIFVDKDGEGPVLFIYYEIRGNQPLYGEIGLTGAVTFIGAIELGSDWSYGAGVSVSGGISGGTPAVFFGPGVGFNWQVEDISGLDGWGMNVGVAFGIPNVASGGIEWNMSFTEQRDDPADGVSLSLPIPFISYGAGLAFYVEGSYTWIQEYGSVADLVHAAFDPLIEKIDIMLKFLEEGSEKYQKLKKLKEDLYQKKFEVIGTMEGMTEHMSDLYKQYKEEKGEKEDEEENKESFMEYLEEKLGIRY